MKNSRRTSCAPILKPQPSYAAALRSRGLGWPYIILVLFAMLPQNAPAATGPGKLLRRLLAPFRSNPFLQRSRGPCSFGFQSCFLPSETGQPAAFKFEPVPLAEDSDRIVTMQLRSLRRGPFCHHWLELDSSYGKVTMGFGPATVPFIDAGQISLRDAYGNIERISGMYPVPVLGPPPVNYHYAKAPGTGRAMGKPVPLTVAQADALIQKERSRKFIGPYVPIFHDCRTYACSVAAHAQGRSSLPCYLLFKGYW